MLSRPLSLTRSPGALRRLLIPAKAEESRLPKLAVRRPFRKRNLRDQARANPGHPANYGGGGKGRPICLKSSHFSHESGKRGCRESRSDLAHEPQFPPIEEPHQQRAEMGPRTG